jgi:3-hydroxyisobutyrate dehydrogenase
MSQNHYRAHQTVGFVGLGMMGSRMVRHLKGYADLLIFDVDAERAQQAASEANGRAVSSINDLAKSDVVILMLPNSKIVDIVVRGGNGQHGLLDILSKGAMIIDMSSATPANTIENEKLASGKGLIYMDAPVSGGPGGAESGKLAIMVGATADDFAHAKPLLDKMGTNVILAGHIGSWPRPPRFLQQARSLDLTPKSCSRLSTPQAARVMQRATPGLGPSCPSPMTLALPLL